ncbi:MAG: YpdA family putative bacillithiol disulfide reductase [Acidobacteriota bacterium]|nr:YpdA family putative bacillithiol disulfide reductase [Acidobacteriota bacterium]
MNQSSAAGDTRFDLLVIGAGPTGLASAIEAQRAGFRVVLIEKGCLVNSLYHYPPQMLFFTTPELLEIGDIPFPSAHQKPTREEALEYYRKVTEHYQLNVRQYERVERVAGSDGDFQVHTRDRVGAAHVHHARKLAVATGYYDLPNSLGVPGEELPKVLHYYGEPHPYFELDVVVVGGKNSAAIAALELWRRGARVTLVHRGPGIHANVKYWIRPDIENRIQAGEVRAYFESRLREIGPDYVIVAAPDGDVRLKNDFVFALTGYHPDYSFMRSLGIALEPAESRPVSDPESLETNVPGIYVAGVIVAGSRTSEIFIENGRFHGRQIARSLHQKLRQT